MNHTGTRSTAWPRAARSSGADVDVGRVLAGAVACGDSDITRDDPTAAPAHSARLPPIVSTACEVGVTMADTPTPTLRRADVTDDDTAPAQSSAPAPTSPDLFRRAVAAITSTRVRREISVEPVRPPQRLAPYSYAISADVRDAAGDELATGRLVLLHDPEGSDAWDGVLRLVGFASAEMDPQIGVDPLLPAVGWSWLTDALEQRSAAFRAAGGTVTQTTSSRFGDIAGPRTTVELELRASWTADDADLTPHVLAFADLLATAAGLPPEGVTVLPAH